MTPERRLKSMPVSCQGIYKAAMTGRSRAKGVKAFCQECVGYERKFVRNCSDTGCPLYPYRPHKQRDFDDEDEESEMEEETTILDAEPKEAPPLVVEKEATPPAKKRKKKKKASSLAAPKKAAPSSSSPKKNPRTKGRFANRK